MSRLLDLVAIVIVALVLLLPRPSINAFPAAQGDRASLERLSALQDALYRTPGDAALAVELAGAYRDVGQPAWALTTLHPYLEGERRDPRVHRAAAFALAELLRPRDALRHAEIALAACEAPAAPCPQTERIRLSYLAEMMRKLAEAGVDPHADPLKARRLVSEALHATRASSLEPGKDQPAAPKAP
jgi:hypothetical protein